MIASDDVINGFLAACPGLRNDWEDRVPPEDVDGDAPTDIGNVGNYLRDCYRCDDVAEFPSAFSFLERCVVEGDDPVRESCVHLLFPLYLNLRGRPDERKAFEEAWLGPYAKAMWQVCEPLHQTLAEGLAPFIAHVEGNTVEPPKT